MNIIIDRIEGDFAVVEAENGCFYNVPKAIFPNCSEGDVYTIEKDGTRKAALKDDVKDLVDELFK